MVEVIRNGNTTSIKKKDVVVGDIVVLNTGEEIPADGELLEAVTLNVDESFSKDNAVTLDYQGLNYELIPQRNGNFNTELSSETEMF